MNIDEKPRSAGTPCWLEIGGPVDPAVLDFWCTALGWEVDANTRVAGYRRGHAGGRKVAGFGGPSQPVTPRGWRVYLHVDDLTAVLGEAVPAGAEILVSETAAGPDGRFAFVRDPFGVVTGLFEPANDPGTTRETGPGRVIGWRLAVGDPVSVQAFYSALLPGFGDHVELVMGDSGWAPVLAAAPRGAAPGEVADPAGNTLTVVALAPTVVAP